MSITFDPKFIKFSKATGSTLLNNLLVYWALDDNNSAQTAAVHSGAYGAVTGATYYSTDSKLGHAIDFTGATNKIEVVPDAQVQFTGADLSISCWFKLDTLPHTAGHIMELFSSAYSTSPYNTIRVILDYDGTIDGVTFVIYDSGGAVRTYYSTDDPYSTGSYYHLCIVHTGGALPKIYLNATDIYTANTGGVTTGNVPTMSYLYLGNNVNDNPYGLDGRLDEVGVWNRALTLSEVQELYNSGTGRTYPFS